MRFYIINLARRPDRRERITTRLSYQDLDFSFIDAFDSESSCESLKSQYVSSGRDGCVKSHALAMQSFLQSGDDYAIILEDDAVLNENVDWPSLTASLKSEMASTGLSYLQLGFLSEPYASTRVRRGLKFLMRKTFVHKDTPPSLCLTLGGETYKVILGESRAGTHCYVVSRSFAESAPAFNNPAWVSADGFFDRLASANGTTGYFLMGRMDESLAEQESRQSDPSQIDSDIG